MKIVHKGEDVLNFPGTCVLTGDGEGPFLDTDTWLNARDIGGVDPYGYISVAKVRDMGREIGMVPKEDVDALREQLDAYGEKVEALTKQVEALTTLKEAVDEITDPAHRIPDWVR